MNKIVSVTLSGNSSALISDAIMSVVDWVDECILVDTGITDDTIEIAKKVAKKKLVIDIWPWRDDFSAARNHCLDIAKDREANYVFVLDTDERIENNGDDIRSIIENASPEIISFHMLCRTGTYGKVRCLKLPCEMRYVGPTHEVITSPPPQARLDFPKARFWEVPKTPGSLKNKFERDVRILTKHIKDNYRDPRWHYYLGDSHKNLCNYTEAINSYENCWKLAGWDEESAWSMYQCAQCWISLGKIDEAIECCARGMARHPGIAELSWLAGWCCYNKGDYQRAEYWSRLSIAAGNFVGFGASVSRIGFRHPPAQWEGPFDVLAWSLRSMGRHDEASIAFQNNLKAQIMRNSKT